MYFLENKNSSYVASQDKMYCYENLLLQNSVYMLDYQVARSHYESWVTATLPLAVSL